MRCLRAEFPEAHLQMGASLRDCFGGRHGRAHRNLHDRTAGARSHRDSRRAGDSCSRIRVGQTLAR